MKKLIMLMALILVAMISVSQNKTGTVVNGRTSLKYPMNFTAGDTIIASKTYWILVDSRQNYAQIPSIAITLDSLSGTPSIAISLEGKASLLDDYTEIVAAATWDSETKNPFAVVASSGVNYRYFKIKFVATSAVQKTKVTALTFSTTYQNISVVAASTGAFSSNVTIGGTLVSTGLITANGGVTLGAGDDLIGSSTSDITINTNKFTVDGANGDVVVGRDQDVVRNLTAGTIVSDATIVSTTTTTANTGLVIGVATPDDVRPSLTIRGDADSDAGDDITDVLSLVLTPNATATNATWGFTSTQSAGYTFDKKVTATGGVSIASQPTVYWAAGGAVALGTSGYDAAATDGGRFWVELNIPYNSTITGLSYLIGSVGGTDSVVVQLCNSAGVQVATSRAVGGAATLVGSAANFQNLDFTAPYAAVAGRYFAVVQFNGTTAKYRAYPIPGSRFIGNTAVGTWGTAAAITPGVSFVPEKAPIMFTY